MFEDGIPTDDMIEACAISCGGRIILPTIAVSFLPNVRLYWLVSSSILAGGYSSGSNSPAASAISISSYSLGLLTSYFPMRTFELFFSITCLSSGILWLASSTPLILSSKSSLESCWFGSLSSGVILPSVTPPNSFLNYSALGLERSRKSVYILP